MPKKKVTRLLSFLLVLVGLTLFGTQTTAVENQNGAQVTTKGVISFDETGTTNSSQPTTSSTAPVMKPAGRLPATGEIVWRILSILGILLFSLLLFIFQKRKKKKEADQ